MELVDTQDLKSCNHCDCTGSTPVPGTKISVSVRARAKTRTLIFFDPHSISVSRLINYRDFRFSKLKVYTKAKVFHLDCKRFIVNARPDSYVKDVLGRASF